MESSARALSRQKEALLKEAITLNDYVKNHKDTLTAIRAEVMLNQCNQLQSEFRHLKTEIISKNSALKSAKSKVKIPAKDFESFSVMFCNIAEICMTAMANGVKSPPSESSPRSEESSQSTSSKLLPKIQLPVFDGTIGEFTGFINLFNSLVHRSSSLSPLEKLTYLLKSTTKEPHSIVTQYPVASESYQLAYDALIRRYNNPRRLASFHYHNLQKGRDIKEVSVLLEHFRSTTSALSAIPDVDLADFFMFEGCYNQCPTHLQRSFDQHFHRLDQDVPRLSQLLEHLEKMARTEELKSDLTPILPPIKKEKKPFQFNPTIKSPGKPRHQEAKVNVSTSSQQQQQQHCFVCDSDSHLSYVCPSFKSWTVEERKKIINDKNRCQNCFAEHATDQCYSPKRCRACRGKHHTMLHVTQDASQAPTQAQANHVALSPLSQEPISPGGQISNSAHTNRVTVFPTVLCYVSDGFGHKHPVRACLDSASEINIISENLSKRLNLPRFRENLQVVGVGNQVQNSMGKVNLMLSKGLTIYNCQATILPTVCTKIPASNLSPEVLDQFKDIELSDKEFGICKDVELLLGVQSYSELLESNIYPNIIKGNPTAVLTKFGWVVMGSAPTEPSTRIASCNQIKVLHTRVGLDLTKFWEIESINQETGATLEDELCEKQFRETHSRQSDGRYMVKLPFIPGSEPENLDNRQSTYRRYLSFESRLQSKPELIEPFNKFMGEIINQNHMSVATSVSNYLLPYHCVLKPDSSTTPVRAVFNASATCNNGTSLNSLLFAGPNLAADLSDIILRFRVHNYVMCTDIQAMFRQILVHPEHRKFQHIWYRPKPQSDIQEYEFNTVIYGYKSSPFLAQRVLKQLAEDEQTRFPEASKVLLENTYMDDISFGSSDIQSLINLRDQLIGLMSSAGFNLRKWASNTPASLIDLPEDHCATPLRVFSDTKDVLKVLGVQWLPTQDVFQYHVTRFENKPTKRTILSFIAKIFDPNGMLTPLVFLAKCIMQQLWLAEIDWDQPLPEPISNHWAAFIGEIESLEDLHIPRSLQLSHGSLLSLVGFSDASLSGYSAVVYLHVQNGSNCHTRLLRAKSKVSPIKKGLTIPRLELLGALLLSKAMTSVINALPDFKFNHISLYSDSQIFLAWVAKSPFQLQAFVGHRIQTIQGLTKGHTWNYVPTNLNPADLACRGLTPKALCESSMWWHGPDFLLEPHNHWPEESIEWEGELPELKAHVQVANIEPKTDNILRRFSSFTRLTRVMAWVLRFVNNCRKQSKMLEPMLTVSELNKAKIESIKITQRAYFSEEIDLIKNSKLASTRLRPLNPYLDEEDVLRVGGRIQNAFIPYKSRHPILLPKQAHLSTLICQQYHRSLLHAGPRTTQAFIQRTYWITRIHTLVRKLIHECITCHRLSGKPTPPVMAPLPAARLESGMRCFNKIGTDFAGPFITKESNLRKSPRHEKSYFMIIVCFSTKAVHLEAVTDMTSEAFLAAFHRFTSRRGCPSSIFTDQGRNFIGARRQLKEWSNFFIENKDVIYSHLSTLNIEWVLNVPLASHMAGLHEAAVKSAKNLIKKTIGDTVLTFEEFNTVLTRVEASLNSRPLGAVNGGPSETDYLSPGHFLIGGPILAPPEAHNDSDIPPLDRWKRVQHISSQFWKRWSKEYIQTLVQQKKWFRGSPNLQPGQLVYLCDLPNSPLSWPLGRIEQVHPGPDGVTRAASVRTSQGTYLRPVHKLLLLPVLSSP